MLMMQSKNLKNLQRTIRRTMLKQTRKTNHNKREAICGWAIEGRTSGEF